MDEVLAAVIQLYIRTNEVLIELQEFLNARSLGIKSSVCEKPEKNLISDLPYHFRTLQVPVSRYPEVYSDVTLMPHDCRLH